MTLITRLAIILITLLFLGAPSCGPSRFEWQGPSNWFKVIDRNTDGDISRIEWEYQYLRTSIYSASFNEFEFADCNHNGRLTWHEYFQSNFNHRHCDPSGGPLYSSASSMMTAPHTELFPAVLSDIEIRVLTSNAYGYKEGLQRGISQYPNDISEDEASAAELASIQIKCGETYGEIVPDRFTNGASVKHPAIKCTIDNDLENADVSLLVLSITAEIKGAINHTWHAKAVHIPSQTTSNITVFLGNGTGSATVQLENIRIDR